jgi:hypothetical protein
MLTKTVTAAIPNEYNLTNFSMECTCGKVYSFKTINQTHTCTCGRIISISAASRARLVKTGAAQPAS